MAISEEVKIDVASRVSTLQAQNKKDLADIAAHEAAVATLTARMVARSALIVKYDRDVPKPTPAPIEF